MTVIPCARPLSVPYPPKHPAKGLSVKGTDGHVYYMLVDAEHLTSPSMVTPPSEFAGIAATSPAVSPTPCPISSAHIEEDDNVGWLATKEELHTTVDWYTFRLPPSSLALAASETSSSDSSYLSTCPF